MPSPLPYLSSYKNIEKLFTGISNAKVPDSFGQKFLTEALGLKSNGDRPLIPFLRTLGFLDGSNKPTSAYNQLKNPSLKAKAIAAAIKMAYAPLFTADENANNRNNDDLKGLVAQVSGADSNTVSKTMGTLNALLKLADFSSGDEDSDVNDDEVEDGEDEDDGQTDTLKIKKRKNNSRGEDSSSIPFHFNIQVHLPANATEEVYLNIFNAIRKVFN